MMEWIPAIIVFVIVFILSGIWRVIKLLELLLDRIDLFMEAYDIRRRAKDMREL